MSAIYLHIPFCKRVCGYCDFFKSVQLQHMPAAMEAMRAELVSERDFLEDKHISTIYFGGGTPSLLSVEDIASLLDVIHREYDCSDVQEVTLEANPDDLNLEYLRSLRTLGVNRLSIGVQSFNDAELRFMNRRHSAEQAQNVVRMAQSVGFDNITIDLIFGVAGFGEDILRDSVAKALALGVQHISAYHLTIEPNTLFARRVARREFSAVDEAVSEREYAIIESMLSAAGYEHYEVSNYALPSYRSRHNSSYWHGVHYLGVGAGAHSYNGKVRRWSKNSIEEYLAGGDNRYECESLSEAERFDEYIMTSLRCAEGVDLEYISDNFSQGLYLYILEAAQQWLDSGKLKRVGERLVIPTEHFLISDSIIESLFVVAE